MRDGMLRAFGRFPNFEFIWKFHEKSKEEEKEEIFKTAKNVHTFKWVDQAAILSAFFDSIMRFYAQLAE